MIHLKALGILLLILAGLGLYAWLVIITNGVILIVLLAVIGIAMLVALAYDLAGYSGGR